MSVWARNASLAMDKYMCHNYYISDVYLWKIFCAFSRSRKVFSSLLNVLKGFWSFLTLLYSSGHVSLFVRVAFALREIVIGRLRQLH